MTASLSKDELMVAIYGVWHIWKERCRRTFQDVSLTEVQLLDMIRDDLLVLGSSIHARTEENNMGEAVIEANSGE